MKKLLLVLFVIATALSSSAIKIDRIEPISWWVGMNTPLQLLLNGEDITGATVEVNSEDITIEKVINADSPNYLFVDVKISPDTKPGKYTFTVKKGKKKTKVDYMIEARRTDAAAFNSLTPADVIYLLMPDRFAKGELPKGLREVDGLVDRNEMRARHGGNIQGVIDNLDYIEDLGATAIWSTPLLTNLEDIMSYHGYAICDLYEIDPRFGTNQMYSELVEKSHEKGLKVIMDMVPNHVGVKHWWMKDYPFTDWINSSEKTVRASLVSQSDPYRSELDYTANRDTWFDPIMPDVNLLNPYMLQYMKQNAVWWVEYANIDAIRIDTYPYSDKYCVAEWTQAIKDEYPGITLMGECWIREPGLVAYWEGGHNNKDGYDSKLPMVMDFPLQDVLTRALSKDENRREVFELFNLLSQDFLYDDPFKLLIFATNHDTSRLASFTNGSVKKQILAYSLLTTLRGIPQIYYGDEQMLAGYDSGDYSSWRADFPGGWDEDERNLFTGEGRTAAEDSMYQYSRKVINWRKTSDAVINGKMMQFTPGYKEGMYVYARYTDDELVFVILNFSSNTVKLDWDRYKELFVGRPTTGLDIVSDKNITIGEEVILQPHDSIILQIK
ncbi:MAG: alpha-amylase family glycosyl hydrolase [Bacteroidales bacterium]